MRTITFDVNQQKIKNTNSIAYVYSGSHNYLNLKFNFSDDWVDCFKAITFVSKGYEIAYLLDADNSHTVPKAAFDANTLTFYLVGKKKNYRIESQKFTIRLATE